MPRKKHHPRTEFRAFFAFLVTNFIAQRTKISPKILTWAMKSPTWPPWRERLSDRLRIGKRRGEVGRLERPLEKLTVRGSKDERAERRMGGEREKNTSLLRFYRFREKTRKATRPFFACLKKKSLPKRSYRLSFLAEKGQEALLRHSRTSVAPLSTGRSKNGRAPFLSASAAVQFSLLFFLFWRAHFPLSVKRKKESVS